MLFSPTPTQQAKQPKEGLVFGESETTVAGTGGSVSFSVAVLNSANCYDKQKSSQSKTYLQHLQGNPSSLRVYKSI